MMNKRSVSALLIFGLMAALMAQTSGTADARSGYRHYYKSPAAKRYAARYRSRYRANLNRRRVIVLRAIPDTPPQGATGKIAPPAQRPFKLLTRDQILATDPDRLERLGRRLVVGFQSFSEVKPLVEKRAIAGIFITDHNVRGRKAVDVAKDIQDLQDIRRTQGLPRLIVAADQEGGYVSRLSPPLTWQPSLGMLIEKLNNDTDREKAVRDYAEVQAHDLERLGVTMNFGPVIDLRLGNSSRDDGETRIYWRAIDSDPYLVAKVAGWYCDTLAKFNIICTLKHFPGLGRVARDTHVATGTIGASVAQLELSDWVPFRRLGSLPGVATMIGHVRVDALDRDAPASYSDVVVSSIIRGRWHDDGLLITDDLSMGAVTGSKEGIGAAAIKSLNAGIDILLLSYTERHFDTVMSALIEADANGEIDQGRQSASRERLKKYVFIDDREPPLPPRQAQQVPIPMPLPQN
jgi:beta-N-acetylhexosaminidase